MPNDPKFSPVDVNFVSTYKNPKWKLIDEEFARLNEQAKKAQLELDKHNANYVAVPDHDLEF